MSLIPAMVFDLSTGKPRRATAGDTLSTPTASNNTKSFTNDNASAITLGMVVYVAASNHVDKAQANAAGTAAPIGLVADASIANGAAGNVQTSGILASADWTAVTGGTTLTFNADYFLDEANPGKLKTTCPTTGYACIVGKAVSTTELYIDIETEIKL